MTVPAAEPRPSPPGGSVTMDDHTLVMTGDVDRATIRATAHHLTPDRLATVTTIELSTANYLHSDAVHLLLRCLQQNQRHHPTRRVQLHGADDQLLAELDMLGITQLLDLDT